MTKDEKIGQEAYLAVLNGTGTWASVAKKYGKKARYAFQRGHTYANRYGHKWPITRFDVERSYLYTEEGLRQGEEAYWLRWWTAMPWEEMDEDYGRPRHKSSILARTFALKFGHEWPIRILK